MDLFIDLYTASSSASSTLDFRYPILTALEGILLTEEGVSMFLAQNSWSVLSDDLKSVITNTTDTGASSNISEPSRGIEIIRVLLAIIDHESSTSIQEEWMEIVKPIASMKINSSVLQHPIIVEFQIALLQLAAALFLNASQGMVKRYRDSLSAILGVARQVGGKGGALDVELRNELEDVVLGLEGLRV